MRTADATPRRNAALGAAGVHLHARRHGAQPPDDGYQGDYVIELAKSFPPEADSCLPLAETASTFGEMMLVDKMLAGESDEAVRRDLLFRQMDDAWRSFSLRSDCIRSGAVHQARAVKTPKD